MTKRQTTISCTTPHYAVAINGVAGHDKLTLSEAAALLSRNGVKIEDKDLVRHLWQGVGFKNEFGFTCSVYDQFSLSHPNDDPPTHLNERDFYDSQKALADARQKDFEARLSQA
jgi:hypothetical protein